MWVIDRRAKAIWHPMRVRIYELLLKGPVTLKEMGATLKQPLKKLEYHSDLLCGAGCIQAAGPDPANPLFEIASSPPA